MSHHHTYYVTSSYIHIIHIQVEWFERNKEELAARWRAYGLSLDLSILNQIKVSLVSIECVLYRMCSLQNVFSTECVLYRMCSLQNVFLYVHPQSDQGSFCFCTATSSVLQHPLYCNILCTATSSVLQHPLYCNILNQIKVSFVSVLYYVSFGTTETRNPKPETLNPKP